MNTATVPPSPFPITQVTDGFRVTPDPTGVISCRIYNQAAAPAEITTHLSAANNDIPVSNSASDTATLHDFTTPVSGTVEHRVYPSLAACQAATAAFPPPSGGTFVSTVTVGADGTVPSSGAHGFTVAGTSYWAAFFTSTNDLNRSAASNCGAEPVDVSRASPPITTHVTPRELVLGGTVTDTATLVSPHTPIAAGTTVNYRFYDSVADCDTARDAFLASTTAPPTGGTDVDTVDVAADGTVPPASHTFSSAGTFYWAAFFSGDTSNNRTVSDCTAEAIAVNMARPEITTKLSAANHQIDAGLSAHDTATFTPGTTHHPSGTVEYRFFDSLAECDAATAAFTGLSRRPPEAPWCPRSR